MFSLSYNLVKNNKDFLCKEPKKLIEYCTKLIPIRKEREDSKESDYLYSDGLQMTKAANGKSKNSSEYLFEDSEKEGEIVPENYL